jgi:hypothetical protein
MGEYKVKNHSTIILNSEFWILDPLKKMILGS